MRTHHWARTAAAAWVAGALVAAGCATGRPITVTLVRGGVATVTAVQQVQQAVIALEQAGVLTAGQALEAHEALLRVVEDLEALTPIFREFEAAAAAGRPVDVGTVVAVAERLDGVERALRRLTAVWPVSETTRGAWDAVLEAQRLVGTVQREMARLRGAWEGRR